jgi:hypothetical protein
MLTVLELPVSQSANRTFDDLTHSTLFSLESQHMELGARLAGLEGVVFALGQQLTEVRRQLRELMQPSHDLSRAHFAQRPAGHGNELVREVQERA